MRERERERTNGVEGRDILRDGDGRCELMKSKNGDRRILLFPVPSLNDLVERRGRRS